METLLSDHIELQRKPAVSLTLNSARGARLEGRATTKLSGRAPANREIRANKLLETTIPPHNQRLEGRTLRVPRVSANKSRISANKLLQTRKHEWEQIRGRMSAIAS
jgi:hypothetical protein